MRIGQDQNCIAFLQKHLTMHLTTCEDSQALRTARWDMLLTAALQVLIWTHIGRKIKLKLLAKTGQRIE